VGEGARANLVHSTAHALVDGPGLCSFHVQRRKDPRARHWLVGGPVRDEVFPVCMSVPLLVIHTNYVLLVLAEVYMMIVLCSCSLGWRWVTNNSCLAKNYR